MILLEFMIMVRVSESNYNYPIVFVRVRVMVSESNHNYPIVIVRVHDYD